MKKKKVDIHFHRFNIYKRQFLIFKKLIGYEYMKCGIDSSGNYDRYPDGLPDYTGIELFNFTIGGGSRKYGECPKSEDEIELNKDDQGDIIL